MMEDANGRPEACMHHFNLETREFEAWDKISSTFIIHGQRATDYSCGDLTGLTRIADDQLTYTQATTPYYTHPRN